MKLGYQTNTWGGVVGHPAGVTSIKDQYYLTNGSTEEAVEDIASAGYKGIEIFEGNLVQYENRISEFKELLKTHSLTLIGVYTGANFIYREILEEELAKIERVAKLAAELGAEHLVIGGGAIRSKGIEDTDYKLLAEGLNQAINIAETYNLVASYHPHLGSMVETPEQLEKLLKYTDINLCPDTAHIEAGGGDPVEFIRKYYDRIKYVHLKDCNKTGEFLPLGEGHQDFPTMIKLLKDVGYKGWITVELDSYPNPAKGAQQSKGYLLNNFQLK